MPGPCVTEGYRALLGQGTWFCTWNLAQRPAVTSQLVVRGHQYRVNFANTALSIRLCGAGITVSVPSSVLILSCYFAFHQNHES